MKGAIIELETRMVGVPRVIKTLEGVDLAKRFEENFIRLENGRVNEILYHEVYSKIPTSYVKMLLEGDYFVNRYVS